MASGPTDQGAHDGLRNALANAKAFGFLGPGPVEVHLAAAGVFAAAIRGWCGQDQFTGRALDLGTGAGVPGLILAVEFSESSWTLVDAASKRTSVLAAAVAELGLSSRVEVVRARAEELGRDPRRRLAYEVVTARSFGPPAMTAEFGAPFVRPGGVLLVSEPPEGEAPAGRWAGVEQLGLEVRPQLAHGDMRVAALVRVAALDDRFPRPVQPVRRHPLF